MVRKAIWALSVVVIVALSLSIVLNNSEPITLRITPNWPANPHNKGVVLLLVFLTGVLCTCLVWAYFGIKAYIREKRLEHKERRRQHVYQSLAKARGYLASGDWQKAYAAWEQVIRRDPGDIIARLELAHCLEAGGDYREALRMLDAARAIDPTNLEVLFRAAQVNRALGNNTAAIDNLALTLYQHPSAKAAALARDYSEELERIDDALEYQEKLEAYAPGAPGQTAARARLEFKRLLRDSQAESRDSAAMKQSVKAFLKRHPDYPPALEKLAQINEAEGRIDDAAQLLADAARHSGEAHYWRRAAELWTAHGMTSRALAAARAAAANAEGVVRINAVLFLIHLCLSLGDLEQARNALELLPKTAEELRVDLQGELLDRYLTLKGLCAQKLGEHEKATEVWDEVAKRLLPQQLSLSTDKL